MIPDRLYIDESELPKVNNLPMDNPITYIRKDALLEWLEGCKNNPVITDLQKGNIQELIDHINEM